MNYGGHYRNTPQRLARRRAPKISTSSTTSIVNKEERIPDIAQFRAGADPAGGDHVLLLHAQEYHTSFWGHLGLLHLDDHLLLPDFSSYRHTALASPYPHNGVIADLAHAQDALVGYVHPFDFEIDPAKEKSLTNALPADVALGKVDYLEVVGFSDHQVDGGVWYRLLNLGFRLPAGAGTDAMANYASLRGPVGLTASSSTPAASARPRRCATRSRQGAASRATGRCSGSSWTARRRATVQAQRPGQRCGYRVALRSPVAVDHLELVHNGRVVATSRSRATGARFDAEGELPVDASGWVVLRAWNERRIRRCSISIRTRRRARSISSCRLRDPRRPGTLRTSRDWLDRVINQRPRARRFQRRARAQRDARVSALRAATLPHARGAEPGAGSAVNGRSSAPLGQPYRSA